MYPPNPSSLEKSLKKLQLIIKSCRPKCILIDGDVKKLKMITWFYPKISKLWPSGIPYQRTDLIVKNDVVPKGNKKVLDPTKISMGSVHMYF